MTETSQRVALVTGSAGFIGFHTAKALLADGWSVIGLDALTDYYDVSLKERRHAILCQNSDFQPIIGRVEAPEVLEDLFAQYRPDLVVHLAAQAGVRHSIDNPRSYLESNIAGTFELLEAARNHAPSHLMIASTSSVYGANTEMPYKESDKTDTQMSFYAATKKASEAMAHSYAHLYHIPTTMFRFFTVYGPWGRPDMAYFKFVDKILKNEPIEIYNNGDMARDFTYIDDLVRAIGRLADSAPGTPNQQMSDVQSPVAPYRIVNIGNAQPVQLMRFVEELERAVGRKAQKTFLPMQPGDVEKTWASTKLLSDITGSQPETPIEIGAREFVAWYLDYYNLKRLHN